MSGGGKAKYSVTGDTVNLAARLDAWPQAGETLISDALYREVADSVEAQSAGEHVVKGSSHRSRSGGCSGCASRAANAGPSSAGKPSCDNWSVRSTPRARPAWARRCSCAATPASASRG